MPSFTFVSTANAFVLRGATPVFVDIRPDTLNIDETRIEAAITPRTKAIVPVHYAGVGCEMDAIMDIARRHDLLVIEDAAQGTPRRLPGASARQHRPHGGPVLPRDEEHHLRRGRRAADQRSPLRRARRDRLGEGDQPEPVLPRPGRQVHLGRPRLVLPARRDHRGLPLGADGGGRRDHGAAAGDLGGSTTRRSRIWSGRGMCAGRSSRRDRSTTPTCITCCCRASSVARRSSTGSRPTGIQSVFHYVPLHSSPFGRSVGRSVGDMSDTDAASERLVRLPLWLGLEEQLPGVIAEVIAAARVS